METKKKSSGRPLVGSEKMKPITIRCTPAQREKLSKLGGAPWIRAKIDAAKIG